jgi:hypothetical protein
VHSLQPPLRVTERCNFNLFGSGFAGLGNAAIAVLEIKGVKASRKSGSTDKDALVYEDLALYVPRWCSVGLDLAQWTNSNIKCK